MPIAPYQRVLAIPAARNTLLIGLLVRVPLFAGGVLLTFHVVQTLGRSYTEAGLVATAATVCITISGPWRGRLLDQRGLRKVVLPSLVVTAICWAIAPFSDYLPLLALAALAGLFSVPTFSIIRQAVIVAVPDDDRKTGLALDSVAVELAFMIGPVIGVWAATIWPTSWVLFGIEMSGVAAGLALCAVNPSMTADTSTSTSGSTEPGPDRLPRRVWFTPAFLAICAAAAASTIVLSGSDIAIIAALREFGQISLIGPVLAIWGVGSIIGGLVYGAIRRTVPAFVLLAGLSVATMPLGLAPGVWPLSALVFLAGLLCAPTITATVDQLSRVVPERARGEAMGWHGTFMTAGSALGAPVAGAAIDRWGYGGGFLSVGVLGLLVAAVVAVVTSLRRRARAVVAQAPVPRSP